MPDQLLVREPHQKKLPERIANQSLLKSIQASTTFTVLGEKRVPLQFALKIKPPLFAFQYISKKMTPHMIQNLLYLEICKKSVFTPIAQACPYFVALPQTKSRKRAFTERLDQIFHKRSIIVHEPDVSHIAKILQELWEQAEEIVKGATEKHELIDVATNFSLLGRELLHHIISENIPLQPIKRQITAFVKQAFRFAENYYQ